MVDPQTPLRFSCFLLQPLKDRIPWRVLPIPPAPALLDQFLIDVRSIGQDYVSKDAFVPVEAARLDADFLSKGECRGGLLRLLAVSLAVLRAVNPAEADTISMVPVQDFDSVAVENGYDCLVKVGKSGVTKK